jgi:hypothetical protein
MHPASSRHAQGQWLSWHCKDSTSRYSAVHVPVASCDWTHAYTYLPHIYHISHHKKAGFLCTAVAVSIGR